MQHFRRVSLTTIVLAMVALACALPAISLQDPSAVSTSAAQTVMVGVIQTVSSTTLVAAAEEVTFTAIPELPTFTPTASPTQTLTATSTLIFTPEAPQISVSVPTNCRNGPGKVYRMVGALLVGEVAQVYGRDPTGDYWYIRNPDSGSDFCWVWGQYATVTGSTIFLPVYTPPPTPTPTYTPVPTFTVAVNPDFDVSYTGLDTCVDWWPEIELTNTGTVGFRSVGITVRDTVTGVVVASLADEFINKNGCDSTTTRDRLVVGKTRIVSAPAFSYDPSGHKIHATITLCSETGQNGTCVTRTINFTP
jgi:hypothetical protein